MKSSVILDLPNLGAQVSVIADDLTIQDGVGLARNVSCKEPAGWVVESGERCERSTS